MKAILIKPENQSIETVEIENEQQINEIIGFDTVIFDEVGTDGDKLYFDEECFLRATKGRFQVDKVVPVSGIGVITGTANDGSITDIKSDIDDIRSRTKFF